jgi:hypothetical protein
MDHGATHPLDAFGVVGAASDAGLALAYFVIATGESRFRPIGPPAGASVGPVW